MAENDFRLSVSGDLWGFGGTDRDLLRFAIDICNGQGPQGDEVDDGHELGEERGQELPVPAEKVDQHCTDASVEHVIGRRLRTLDEEGKKDDLERIRKDRQDHSDLKARLLRNSDGVLGHGTLLF